MDFYPFTNGFNKQTVDTLKADGRNIHFVDVYTACGTSCSDAGDGQHLGPIGNDIIARTFLTVMGVNPN